MSRIPFYKQQNDYFCGPACAKMLLAPEGYLYSQRELAHLLKTSPYRGTGRKEFAPVFRKHGYVAQAKIHATLDEIQKLLRHKWRVMVNYRETEDDISHFAVVTDIRGGRVIMNDPWHGASYSLPVAEFARRWYGRHRHAYTRWMFAVKPKKGS